MASFAISNFESETAAGFISHVITNGYGLISIAIERINDPEYGANLVECEEALIAAEFVAAALGRAAHDFPEEAAEWMLLNLPKGSTAQIEIAGLVEKAADAIDMIVAESELREFWEEHPEFNEWFQAQAELQERILD